MAGGSQSFQKSKVDGYGFERPEDFDFKSYEEFMASYLSVLARRAQRWKNTVGDQTTAISKSRKIKRFCRKGIPSDIRADVWMVVSGAEQRRMADPELYQRLVDNQLDDTHPVQCAINLDIHRTFPENIHFADTVDANGLRKPLCRVLSAVAKNNTQVGYCQGLNFIVGLLLLIVRDEDKVFWLMDTLINNILPGYYFPDMKALQAEQELVGDVVKWKLPEVAAHMEALGVQWCLVGMKWFICLFADVMPVETVLRIWDCLFFEGTKILHRVALTLVIANKEKILATKTFPEAVDLFRMIVSTPHTQDCHTFMKNIFELTGSFPRSKLEQMREECRKKVK
ncbi:growth hormone-regulated TBC protein 1-like [Haliotis cracherodii]|uniref:growth hormone-regulated TBC protein 1-like n=1 Tax=Haliotis cracherodii TaxID=6455 RepID=UPI0039ECDA80